MSAGGLDRVLRRRRAAVLPQQAFTGKALGDFSVSNKVSSATGQVQDFRPGRTLWIVFQSLGTVASTTESIVSCATGTLAGGKGWWFVRAGTASGAAQKKFFLLSGGGNFKQLDAPPDFGVSVICLKWQASDNHILMSMNGAPFVDYGAISCTPADSSCASYIGTDSGGSFNSLPLTSGRVIAYALWGTEASGAEAVANTYTTGDRFALSATVRAAATVDFNTLRDWNGAAASILTLGSSPITYAVAGSPLRYTVAERRVVASASMFSDGHLGTLTSAFARLRVRTSALSFAVESYSTIYASDNSLAELGLYVGNAYVTRYLASQQTDPQMVIMQPGAGSAKNCDVWEGEQALVTGTRRGTYVVAVRLPLYLADGVTAADSSVVAPAAVQKRLVLFGDSINLGAYATPLVQLAPTALLRADFPTTGTGGVTCLSCGSESVSNVANTGALATATAAAIIAECNGTTNNWVWIALQTNDYGVVQESTALFSAYATALLTALYAAATTAGTPGFVVYWQTAIQRIAPSTEAANGAGATLGNYRTVVSGALAAAFPSMVVVDGAAGTIVSNGNMYTDGLHILAAGAAQIKAATKTAVGY